MSSSLFIGYRQKVSGEQLKKVINYCKEKIPDLFVEARIILAMHHDILFEWFTPSISSEYFNEAIEGWIFNQKGEIHFRHLDGKGFTIVICLEGETFSLPDDFEQEVKLAVGKCQIDDQESYLWGEILDGGWYEGRIPKVLNYPLKESRSASRIKLKIRRYTIHGGDYTRLLGLGGDNERKTN